MTNQEEEPLNCPFCGSPGRLNHYSGQVYQSKNPKVHWWVHCEGVLEGCMTSTQAFPSKKEALKVWNRRAKIKEPI